MKCARPSRDYTEKAARGRITLINVNINANRLPTIKSPRVTARNSTSRPPTGRKGAVTGRITLTLTTPKTARCPVQFWAAFKVRTAEQTLTKCGGVNVCSASVNVCGQWRDRTRVITALSMLMGREGAPFRRVRSETKRDFETRRVSFRNEIANQIAKRRPVWGPTRRCSHSA